MSYSALINANERPQICRTSWEWLQLWILPKGSHPVRVAPHENDQLSVRTPSQHSEMARSIPDREGKASIKASILRREARYALSSESPRRSPHLQSGPLLWFKATAGGERLRARKVLAGASESTISNVLLWLSVMYFTDHGLRAVEPVSGNLQSRQLSNWAGSLQQ